MPKKILLTILAVATIAAAVYLTFWFLHGFGPRAVPPAGQAITVSGIVVCLPHAGGTPIQTQECALGFHANNGVYYALSGATSGRDTTSRLPFGQPITITGVLTGAKPDSQYQAAGTIAVDTYK